MTIIEAGEKSFQELNREIRACPDRDITVTGCAGQRYLADGLSGRSIRVEGIPGNALCAYLDNCRVEVMGNAQDATGDTMNAGEIIIHGSSGDATGYAMRGGVILVEKNVGYRAGIHMKAYEEQTPVLVVGGEAGSFLGEYQAGGLIVVLGLRTKDRAPVGDFCAAGMYGGKLFLRTQAALPVDLPAQVTSRRAEESDFAEIAPYVRAYCGAFGGNAKALLGDAYAVIEPVSANPYRKMYVAD